MWHNCQKCLYGSIGEAPSKPEAAPEAARVCAGVGPKSTLSGSKLTTISAKRAFFEKVLLTGDDLRTLTKRASEVASEVKA